MLKSPVLQTQPKSISHFILIQQLLNFKNKLSANYTITKMNIQTKQREPLQQRLCVTNVPTPSNFGIENKKLHAKLSSSEAYKRLSFYSRQKNYIPTIKEAKLREKQIKSHHKRNFYKKLKNLEDIFKQNCRIYEQLHKQKSHYALNFMNSTGYSKKQLKRERHSVSCSENNIRKQFEYEKASKGDSFWTGDDNFGTGLQRFERKVSFSVGRAKDQTKIIRDIGNNQDEQKGFKLCLRRYEKNKTEMIQKRSKQLHVQIPNHYVSVIQQSKNNKQNDFNQTKNPAYIRFKKRPSSAFKF